MTEARNGSVIYIVPADGHHPERERIEKRERWQLHNQHQVPNQGRTAHWWDRCIIAQEWGGNRRMVILCPVTDGTYMATRYAPDWQRAARIAEDESRRGTLQPA